MPFVKVNEIDLYYEVHGEGPVIVFAHGMGGNHLSWWQQIPFFSKSFQCIIYDSRGKGQSGGTAIGPVEGAFKEDLKGLLDHLGIEKVYLVCQSMGGRPGRNFTVAYPERVKGLVLSGAPGGFDPEIDEAGRKYSETLNGQDRNLIDMVVAKRFTEDQPVKTFLYQQISNLNPPLKWLDPEQVSIQQLTDTKVPIFMLAGEEDIFFMPPMIMDMYKERLLQAEFLTIPETGHSPYFEKPEIFNTEVMRFISQIEAQA